MRKLDFLSAECPILAFLHISDSAHLNGFSQGFHSTCFSYNICIRWLKSIFLVILVSKKNVELCLYIPFSMYWDYPAANICFCYAIKHFIILTSLNFSIPCTWNSRFKNYPKDQDCFTKNVTASKQPNKQWYHCRELQKKVHQWIIS